MAVLPAQGVSPNVYTGFGRVRLSNALALPDWNALQYVTLSYPCALHAMHTPLFGKDTIAGSNGNTPALMIVLTSCGFFFFFWFFVFLVAFAPARHVCGQERSAVAGRECWHLRPHDGLCANLVLHGEHSGGPAAQRLPG
jgi:hypothetical protein